MPRFVTIDLECELCGKAFSHQVMKSTPAQALPHIHASSRFFGIDLCRPCDEELFLHFNQTKEAKRRDGKLSGTA